ncbi:hypothetical protein AB4Z43_02210 [Mesorhizobium sp. 2RAF45]|uniref:hypothetical protein n=1 Tax=Mesorhizobium sp. 2RAF45 TaxID=3233001 RepID=UPI003F98F2F3
MTTPILEIRRGDESQLLHGTGARFVAEADGIVTVKPIDDNAVVLRVPRRATSLRMSAGETMTMTVSPGDTIELI